MVDNAQFKDVPEHAMIFPSQQAPASTGSILLFLFFPLVAEHTHLFLHLLFSSVYPDGSREIKSLCVCLHSSVNGP